MPQIPDDKRVALLDVTLQILGQAIFRQLLCQRNHGGAGAAALVTACHHRVLAAIRWLVDGGHVEYDMLVQETGRRGEPLLCVERGFQGICPCLPSGFQAHRT